jgi:DNA invertase Pin-like site-specific DNA recombinase/F0F1-type ATP synthase membrane subunit b/b'
VRKLRKYIPKDDFDMPKQIDRERFTAVLIRQSDHRADADHVFSRESQLRLTEYARRLRNDKTDEWIRIYDEGAGVSGQKRIDQRKELNRLYNDIKRGLIGSLVVVHEDRLFRDEYHTNDTTFIKLLAEYDVLLFVRTDHRRYDCTKPSDRNALLEKMIASRNYLDDHVLGRMNGNQEAKALQGLFYGNNLPMGLVTQGKKKDQKILVYEPWRKTVEWLFERFKELDNVHKLCHEIEAMPYLFKDPPLEDFMKYTFKIHMTKVPGGFKPTCVETVKYMLANLSYAGALIYKGAIVRWDNHPAIIDRELAIWAYHKITGRDLEGNLLEGVQRRPLRDNAAQAVLKYLLHDPAGPMYVSQVDHPEYVRQTLVKDHKAQGKLFRDITFAIRAHLIDNIFLARVKEIALADPHLAEHIEASINKLEEKHAESIVSIEDHLAQTQLEIQKTLATLNDRILTLDDKSKNDYNTKLAGLRAREEELLKAQEQASQEDLKADYQELSDLLADIPGKLDGCSMAHKQKLARLITESITIEEISVHWLRFTVVWRGPIAVRPDVCLIWRQRGRRSDEWTPEEDEYIKANYPTGDKWMMLAALPRRSWNMIYQRALVLGVHRSIYVQEGIPSNITVDDLNVIPDIDVALRLVAEASKRRKKTEFQAYAVWLYSAGLDEFADEIEHRNINSGSSPSPFHSDSNEGRLRAGRASICRLWYALEGSWLAYAAPSWGSRRCRK